MWVSLMVVATAVYPSRGCMVRMSRRDPGPGILEPRRQGDRHGGDPVVVTLAPMNGQWRQLRLDVLDPAPECIHAAQPAPIEARGDHLSGQNGK
jgi:hypothetical protein